MDRSLASFGAVELATLIRAGELSAQEALNACLALIESDDAVLHAFVTLAADAARAEAAAVDARIAAGEDPGPLAGVPVGIKDLLSTKGLRTTFGSAHYADHQPTDDDIAVARLRKAGAIVVGKTNTSEFGYGPVPRNALFPATCNPWNTALSPGGSSAGSAAAVAAGLVPLALGSDGGGSIRVPAALTGVIGFKPSFGRVPVWPGCRDHALPGVSSWESLEHIGPIARNVADIRLAFSVLVGPDRRDRHSLPIGPIEQAKARDLRIAYSPDLGFAAVDPEVVAIAEASAKIFAAGLGATLETAMPAIGDVQSTFEALVALDTDRRGLRAMREATGIPFGPELTHLLEREWSADDFSDAVLARKRATNLMSTFMADWDFLVTPATAAAAFPLELDHPSTIAGRIIGPGGFAPFSALANLTGLPAIALPAGFTADGRPVGLQLIGRHLGDDALLTTAAVFESARPFQHAQDRSAEARQSFR